MKTILLAGGTGLTGRSLTPALIKKGYRVIIFTRNIPAGKRVENYSFALWNPEKLSYDKSAIEQADAIINLAGAGIADKRWTPERKESIYSSRINSSNTIVKALGETDNHVRVVISASAIGFYGKGKTNHFFREEDPPGKGFLASVCKDWEAAIQLVKVFDKRLVIMRMGAILNADGGAYKKIAGSFRLRTGMVAGEDDGIMSWIHIDDLCNIFIEAIENENLSGIYNICSPFPATNIEIARAIADERFGKRFLKISPPVFLLRLILGDVVDEAILQGAMISTEKLLKTGFRFRFSTIRQAVKDLETQRKAGR